MERDGRRAMIDRLLHRLYWRARRRDARRRARRRGGFVVGPPRRPPLVYDGDLGGYPERARWS
jgi:hypothetical protein